jgi:hypothetical protein
MDLLRVLTVPVSSISMNYRKASSGSVSPLAEPLRALPILFLDRRSLPHFDANVASGVSREEIPVWLVGVASISSRVSANLLLAAPKVFWRSALMFFIREQEIFQELVINSVIPKLIVEVTDRTVEEQTNQIAGWLEETGGLNIRHSSRGREMPSDSLSPLTNHLSLLTAALAAQRAWFFFSSLPGSYRVSSRPSSPPVLHGGSDRERKSVPGLESASSRARKEYWRAQRG